MGLTLALSEHYATQKWLWSIGGCFKTEKKKKKIEDKVYYVLRLFGCLNWFVSRWPLTMSNLHPTYPGHKTLDKNLHRSRFLLFEIENKKMISRKWDHNGVPLRKIQNCPRKLEINVTIPKRKMPMDGFFFFSVVVTPDMNTLVLVLGVSVHKSGKDHDTQRWGCRFLPPGFPADNFPRFIYFIRNLLWHEPYKNFY